MGIQDDFFNCCFDVNFDLDDAMEAKSTAELKLEKLDVIGDRFDTIIW